MAFIAIRGAIPYIISMDLNYDESCKDSFYCLDKVSGPNANSANPV